MACVLAGRAGSPAGLLEKLQDAVLFHQRLDLVGLGGKDDFNEKAYGEAVRSAIASGQVPSTE